MPSLDLWERCASLAQLWWMRHGGVPVEDVARHRLEALVRFARENSQFYRRRYRRVPRANILLHDLPVVRKRELMQHFDEWVTDARIKRADVERFMATRAVGERYLDRYVFIQSSGSGGTPGIFVQDQHALAVYDALVMSQLGEAWTAGAAARLGAWPARAALVAATHGHFASIASWEQSRRVYAHVGAASFSVLDPLPKLVARLNAHRPAFLASYPSVLALLADERIAGRLRIRPGALWSGGEFLAPAVERHIEAAFDAPVVNEYGASECLAIAASCSAGLLHAHSDWVLLEPVDARHRPVRPGDTSHTVLLTNLANWVQPIIRYDLGDRVSMSTSPCPCGSPLPTMHVEGRTDDTLHLRSRGGEWIALPPLALSTVIEDAALIHRFQVVQVAADRLSLRLPADATLRAAGWKRARPAMHAYLERQGLANVRLNLDRGAPRVDRASGKLRTVIALPSCKG
jgi:phenylacetate-CoA ligase